MAPPSPVTLAPPSEIPLLPRPAPPTVEPVCPLPQSRSDSQRLDSIQLLTRIALFFFFFFLHILILKHEIVSYDSD